MKLFLFFTTLLLIQADEKRTKKLIEKITGKPYKPELELVASHLLNPTKKIEPEKKLAKPIEKEKQEENSKPKEIINYERVFESKDFVLKVRAREFKQGEVMFVRLFDSNGASSSNNLKKLNLKWLGKDINLNLVNQVYSAFIPINPEMKVGTYDLEVRNNEENSSYKVCPIAIAKTEFYESKSSEKLKLPKKFAPSKGEDTTDYKFIEECEKLKKQAFESNNEIFFKDNFNLPAKIKKITSNFWAKRNYLNKKGKPHGGVDIRGAKGDPIYAIQDGKVLIARPMYFEGIFTVIDHGSKIYSLYMHQSETLIREGEMVKAGALIGKIGSTGMSTGPHLHLGLKIDGALVNPISIIQLKIK